ncbi:ABC-F family ATP-binding cassette domain-containing protein [Erysipelothrix sp. HDW6A]|uniref:ATP-binding cassette domain-containing protein n=1 Tax=Erysipelothrix sp. HDW6A TaxID=2714928 RepID=UPI00140A81D0|nr:ATP-binding cassette domain-containing protein [Erysipelothrix sp. HDW6A]QIK58091.1 ABC-F family ATP-binding cassette domain-containing protein [Erysipelothrix sp. HDW6A]
MGNESDNEGFFKKAKAVEKRIARIDRLPKPVEIRNQLNLKFNVRVRSGKIVCVADNLAIGYDTVLKDSINFQVNWRDRFAIVADNGVGKSTLIKTILGELDAKEGQIRVGESVKFSYLPQELVFVDSSVRILAYIQKSCGLDEERTRRYLARFGFYQHDMYKPLSYLSGGEQVRLKLLEMMLSDSNCLILDEPTNHLDIMSCEIIEEALREYEGTIIVVSHDRMFLSKLGVSKFYLRNI